MSQTTISKVASFVTLVALVAGCSPTTPQATVSVEAGPTTIAPALSIDACSVPVPAVDPVPGFPARPPQLLGGGVIESGDFTFDMWLFCDPSLSPSDEGAAYSEIAGLGIHLVWWYAGSEVNTGTEYSFGLGDLVIARSGDSGPLTHGSMASYSGGCIRRTELLAGPCNRAT